MKSSPTIKEVSTALAKAQLELKNPALSADNPFFKSKYSPLNEVLAMVRPILAKQGLSILQFPSGDGADVTVTTILLHESGEWIESEPLVIKAVKQDPQGIASSISYGRRYAVMSLLSLAGDSEDDDGNSATHGADKLLPKPTPQSPQKPQKASQKAELSPEVQKAITDLQKAATTHKVAFPDVKKMAEENFNISVLTELSVEQLSELTKIIGG